MCSWIKHQALTAQVAFLSQGDAKVAVPPAKVVGQERRKGQRAVVSQPLLRDTDNRTMTLWK